MTQKILFVDDDANLLAGLKRLLREEFDVFFAQGPDVALKMLREAGPFAVVVADLRMPGMDGLRFLTEVKAAHPDTVRMMLTGNADIQTAVKAIAGGNIARFLTKPCSPQALGNALRAGLDLYRTNLQEKNLPPSAKSKND